MSNPITMYLAKDCGLQVEFVRPFPKVGNPNDSPFPREYKLVNKDQFCFRPGLQIAIEDFTGWLSPTNDLTLPKAARKKAGIPQNAKRYSFMHPPSGLADRLDWEYYKKKLVPSDGEEIMGRTSPEVGVSPSSSILSSCSTRPLRVEPEEKCNDFALAYFAMLGGFVYFDDKNEIAVVNALSLVRTSSELNLIGPFSVPKSVCEDMHAMKRSQLLPMDVFHEIGFKANGTATNLLFQTASNLLLFSNTSYS